MPAMQYTLIDTKLGTFGLGWTQYGVARVALPGDDEALLEQKMRKGGATPGDPPAEIAEVAERIIAYAEGAHDDFSDVEIDIGNVPTFRRSAYFRVRGVGYGKTTTYGDVARQLGDISQARAVGSAMAENPIPLIIPCHRVLAASDHGGFSAPGGVETKLKMLALEHAPGPKGQWFFNF